jgi:hypothetical protein
VCGLIIVDETASIAAPTGSVAPGWADGNNVSSSPWRTTSPLDQDPFAADGRMPEAPVSFPDPLSDSLPAVEPSAPVPSSDLPVRKPVDSTPEYQPPSEHGRNFESAAFQQQTPNPPAVPISRPLSPDDPVFDHPSVEAPEAAPLPPGHELPIPSRPAHRGEPAANSRPRRVGHDGVATGSGLNPIGEAPATAAMSTATRTVLAFSSRIEGDIKYGPSRNHKLLSAGLLGAALLALGVAGSAGVFAASAGERIQAVTNSAPAPESTLDLVAFALEHGANVVRVEKSDCGVRSSTTGIVTDETTVLVPSSFGNTDTSPTIITPDGERVGAQVLGTSWNHDLAVIRVAQPLDSGGFGWSGANKAPVGTELVILAGSPGRLEASSVFVTGTSRNNDGLTSQLSTDQTDLPPTSVALRT